jgi:hypothetical protein
MCATSSQLNVALAITCRTLDALPDLIKRSRHRDGGFRIDVWYLGVLTYVP